MSVEAAKRKQFSRNKKKNWRRFLDTKDVDAFNEEKLKDELSGGPLTHKADADIFFVDKAPAAAPAPVAKKPKKQQKLLHCEKVLLPNPHTKPISARKERTRARNPAVSKKAVVAAPAPANTAGAAQPFVATVDLWGGNAEDDDSDTVRAPATMRQKPGRGVAAVKLAHPGQSYNPSFDDHVEALSNVVQQLTKEQKAEALWRRKLGTTVQQINSYATYAQEMALQPAEGGEHESDGSAAEESDEEASSEEESESRDPVRKTTAQRNKEARLEAERRQREEAKQHRVRENELNRIRSIKRQLEDEETEHQQELQERQKRKAADTRPKKLSKYKFVVEPMEVQLTEDLAGSLRQLRPEGSLLKDRFKSLQERNTLEVRQKIKLQRRYRLKEYEKRSFKNNPWN